MDKTFDIPEQLPLCVDLDGTLIYSDVLHENIVSLLLVKPWLIFLMAFWALKGRTHLKERVAALGEFDPALLPYDERVLAYLRDQKGKGRKLVLATATIRPRAEAIADHVGLFDEVFASDLDCNLKGENKARLLKARLGDYAYLGNSSTDLPVWREAASVGIANAPIGLARRVAKDYPVEISIPRRGQTLRYALKAMRPYQWVKNILVFVPILTSNHLDNLSAWHAAFLAMLAFNFTASGIYVLNDLSDLPADRKHPRKSRRPFASGRVPLLYGLVAGPLLMLLGLSIAWYGMVLPVLIIYAIASISYTVRFKEFPLVDVFCLAFLYVIRLVGGGVATGYYLSLWLLGFSSFMFLGLAFIKRVAELKAMKTEANKLSRRGYSASDRPMLEMVGVASSFSACLLLVLFVQSQDVAVRYATPEILWSLVPLILFWQLRLWLATARGYMHDDPIIYSAKDWVSWTASAIAVLIVSLANQHF